MINYNPTRNNAHTISCRHKGVVDLIYSSPRTQNLVGPRGVIKQMKKQKKDTNLEL